MIFIGWSLGLGIGSFLAVGLLVALSLPPAIGGILTTLLAALGPLAAPLAGALSIPLALLVGGLALFVLVIVAYALAAVSILGATPVAFVIPTNPTELISRGFMIGLSTAANAVIVSALTGLPMLGSVVVLFGLLTTIPPVAASRFGFQPLLGLLSIGLPMTWLVMPLGILLFIVDLPLALAQSGPTAIRFDFSTFTLETSGGALVNALLPPARGFTGFNLGNFTFLSLTPGAAPATVQTGFAAAGLSAHETGHTLTVAAFGGFFGYVNAVDESILGRRTLAYGEVIPESHFAPRGIPFLPMW
jgi:hypothetical protein